MDMIKTGKFIAQLRKEQGLTQEQLGEKLQVTNKTVSRWETGAYLPPVEVLGMMSELFAVSINELLSGSRLSPEEYREAAEENLKQAVKTSSFTLQERIAFYKRKWLKEHIAAMVLAGVCVLLPVLVASLKHEWTICFISFPLLLIAHGWRNNAMMSYVEQRAFDGGGDV